MRSEWTLVAISLLTLSIYCVDATESCMDAICQNGSVNDTWPALPPNSQVVGSSTWSFFHTAAAYLPENLTSNQIDAFRLLARLPLDLYPSYTGRALYTRILSDTTVSSELSQTEHGDDAQLWMWKVHSAVTTAIPGLKSGLPDLIQVDDEDFNIVGNPTGQIRISEMKDSLRKQVLTALDARWKDASLSSFSAEKLQRMGLLPPDRADIGRRIWTVIHSMMAYLPPELDTEQISSVQSIITILREIHPCEICRQNFASLLHSATDISAQSQKISSGLNAKIFWFKIHNSVTHEQFPARPLFPPWIFSPNLYFSTNSTEMAAGELAEVGRALNWRWVIPQGLDNNFNPSLLSDACSSGDEDIAPTGNIKLQIVVMSKCPYCATLIDTIAEKLKCNIVCEADGRQALGRLQLEILYLGTFVNGSAVSMHGESEVEGDKYGLCAQKLYGKDYFFLTFLACLDENFAKIPANAKSCADASGMDWRLLSQCVLSEEVDNLLVSNFIYTNAEGVPATPALAISGPNFPSAVKFIGAPSLTKFEQTICTALSPTTENGQLKIAVEKSIVRKTMTVIISIISAAILAVSVATFFIVNRRKPVVEELALLGLPSSLTQLNEEEMY